MALTKNVDGVEIELTPEEETELLAEREAIKAERDKDIELNGYKYSRQSAYPEIADQIDMLWHAMDTGEIPKANAFYAARKAIKDEFPKP